MIQLSIRFQIRISKTERYCNVITLPSIELIPILIKELNTGTFYTGYPADMYTVSFNHV